jgi:hypothetical protein
VKTTADRPILQRRVDFSDGSHETKPIGRYFGSIELPNSSNAPTDAQTWLSQVNKGDSRLMFLDPEGKTHVSTGSRFLSKAPGNSEFHFYQPLTSNEKEMFAKIGEELWLAKGQEEGK